MNTSAKIKNKKYHFVYSDLDTHHMRIADDILHAIHNYKGPAGVVLLENVTKSNGFDDVLDSMDAINETYCPYTGSISARIGRDKKNSEKQYTISLRLDAKKAQKTLRTNKSDEKLMKRWLRKCTSKKMSKKKKAIEIAKYIAKKTRYKSFKKTSKAKEADSLLRKGYGNCRAAAELYKEMCKAAGIPSCRRVHGYTKRKGNNHAWNTLILGNTRYYTDVTFYRSHRHERKNKYLVVRKLPRTHVFVPVTHGND